MLAYLGRQHAHRRLYRPSRIVFWLQESHWCSHLRHISTYFAKAPFVGLLQNSGDLPVEGRDTAQLPPSDRRGCRGNQHPAQNHHVNSDDFSLCSQSTPSEPTRYQAGKNRRGQRSLQARVERRERNRNRKNQKRREYRNIKKRWAGFEREDPDLNLISGTLGPPENFYVSEEYPHASPLPPPLPPSALPPGF